MTALVTRRISFVDGVAFADTVPRSPYRERWEREASENHVRSAIADDGPATATVELLTAKIGTVWPRFPENCHVPVLLDLGAGYGRVDLYLGRERGLTCEMFYAVDISETMLRRLIAYRDEYALFPSAELVPICASADDLPLEDASVDLIVSSAVFLHMGKNFVAQALREAARVLKPGGKFVFDVSFPNRRNPWSWVPRLKPSRFLNPNALKYWTRPEVERLLDASGIAARSGGYRVEAAAYALLPKSIGSVAIPGARRINAALGTPRHLQDFFTVTYNAYSLGVLL